MTPFIIAGVAVGISLLALAFALRAAAVVSRQPPRPRLPITAQRVVDAVRWTEAERDRRASLPRATNGKFTTRGQE